jgi:cellulose biosynthesis protein BcsQ
MTTLASSTAPPSISLAERALLSRLVAPATGKGGILKTATVTALASSLAQMGMEILVVDVDSHGIASKRDLGLQDTEHDDDGKSLADALTMTYMTGTAAPPTIVGNVLSYPGGGRVDVVVGGSRLEAAIDAISAISVLQKRAYSHVLGQVLATVTAPYHVVLVDNDPKIKAVRLMVLEAAAFSYAPMDYDIAAYSNGLTTLIEEIGDARQRNPDHVFLGAVAGRIPDPTIRAWRNRDKKTDEPKPGGAMVEIAATIQGILDHEVFDSERSLLPGYPKLFHAMIHYAALNVANARKAGMTVIDYIGKVSPDLPPDSKEYLIVRDYKEFAAELLGGMNAAMEARRRR